MAAIKPGNFKELSDEGNEDYAGFEGSMAHEIEKQLNQLLDRDHLPTLPTDPDEDKEVRDRRRLFVAIARGVVKHLKDEREAIRIEVPVGAGVTALVHPKFDIEGL